jgi:hypothetical protein
MYQAEYTGCSRINPEGLTFPAFPELTAPDQGSIYASRFEISGRETFPNFIFAYFFCGPKPPLTSKSAQLIPVRELK